MYTLTIIDENVSRFPPKRKVRVPGKRGRELAAMDAELIRQRREERLREYLEQKGSGE